ncbi:hypothetical protein [Phenylobacterium sp.]|uniref:hypothetical protein n=1 Tax=Phenylobacterium sp. TaxID=1871053 RepID=UPI0026375619|nr:hypothetical protein [Phenylobacterium sp.]
MTSPVRPPILPSVTPTPATGRGDPARLAAQRAFFDMAMGKAAAPAASTAQPAAATMQPASAATAQSPGRIPRPGSLLDIRV